MTILHVLEVIRIQDEWIKPPGPKFLICVEPTIPLFLRINSDGWRSGSVLIPCAGHKAFLKHDSFIECGDPIDPDSFIVEDAIRKHGILGSVDPALAQAIAQGVMNTATIARKDKVAICIALGFKL